MAIAATRKSAAKPAAKATPKTAPRTAAKAAAKKPQGKVVSIIPESDVVKIPLNKLVLSQKFNVRADNQSDVTDLAANIKALGLKQNLIVVPQTDEKGKATGLYEVNAGGRRFRSLKLLEKNGDIPSDHPVNCTLDTAATAIMSSAAENIFREEMHPADQFAAFRRMIEEQGKTIEQVAIGFGVSATVVKQRLKMANVSPKLLQLFRSGELSLESIMAYALVDDHALQEQVYEELFDENNEPHYIKRALTQDEIPSSHHLVKFVTLEAYEKGGGQVRRDLFSEECWLLDPGYLRKLANEKLGKAAQKTNKEGWGWVEIKPEMPYSERLKYAELRPTYREASAEEKAKIAALGDEIQALEKEWNDMSYDDDGIDEVETKLEKKKEVLQEVIESLKEEITPERMKAAGCIVTVENGKTKILRALVKPEDKQTAEQGTDIPGQEPAGAAKKKEQGISQPMTLRLLAQKSLGLQACLAQRPKAALALVTAQLLARLLATTNSKLGSSRILNISPNESRLHIMEPAYKEAKAFKARAEMQEEAIARIPPDAQQDIVSLTRWVLTLSLPDTLDLLAVAAAPHVDAALPSHHYNACRAQELHDVLGLDMSEWWTADVQSYLGSVPKPLVVRAVQEACGSEAAHKVSLHKKGPAADMAASMLSSTRWLPAELRNTITPDQPAGTDEDEDEGGDE